MNNHRHTGLEILGGADTNLPGARTSRGVQGMLSRKILKNRVSLMPFPALWFLCMEQVTNKNKILRILVKQNMNRKIA